MIENLLAYGFANKEQPSVETALTEIKGAITKFKSSDAGYGALTKDLKEMKKQVEVKEKQFYNKLGVSDFEDLNNRIAQIERKYDALLPNGQIIDAIKSRFNFLKVSGASDQELADAVEYTINEHLSNELENNNELFNFSIQKALDENFNDPVDAMLAYLQKNFSYSRNGKTRRFITSRAMKGGYSQKVGLGKIVSTYDRKTNKIAITLEGLDKISHQFKKKLEDDLYSIYSKEFRRDGNSKINVYDLSKEAYRDYINSIIHLYLKIPLNIDKYQYDLNRSIASTLGYLGEVRATLILQELAPDLNTRATGNLRTAIKGQEIPIDIVCAANGFQIKNYTLDNSVAIFSNTMLVPNWVSGRLKLTGEIYDLLIGLFGIYQYNQPLSDTVNPPPSNLEEYKNLYGMIESELFADLKMVFDSRIPQMLKVSDSFSVGGDSLFHSRRLYFNTFFWINKYLVPASWILEQLIAELEKADRSKKTISSAYTFQKQAQGSKDRFQISGQEFRQTGNPPASLYDMASKVKVTYNISIDLTKFANLRV